MASMKFSYRSGQRPLDGYTLKRGVGQGAFGEVYFAVSDGGKEVALKMLRGTPMPNCAACRTASTSNTQTSFTSTTSAPTNAAITGS